MFKNYGNGRDVVNIATKKMHYIFIVGVVPLLLFLLIYMNNQSSNILGFISDISNGVPELMSANNPLLSSVMSFYVKTSPLYGVVFFIVAHKDLKLNTSLPLMKVIIALLLFTLFYLLMSYFLLAYEVELTESGRFVRFLSGNNYLLTAFFIGVFYVCYTLTCYYISFIFAVCMILKMKNNRA